MNDNTEVILKVIISQITIQIEELEKRVQTSNIEDMITAFIICRGIVVGHTERGKNLIKTLEK